MNESQTTKRPLPLWRRILLILILLAMVSLGLLMLTRYVITKQLGSEIVKINRAKEPVSLTELEAVFRRPDQQENAQKYYIEALTATNPQNLQDLKTTLIQNRIGLSKTGKEQFPKEALKDLTNILVSFQPVRQKVRRGTALELPYFDMEIGEGGRVYSNHMARTQTVCALLSLQSLELTLTGKDTAAADCIIDTLKLTRVFDFQPITLLYTIKNGIILETCEQISLLIKYGRPSARDLSRLQTALSETMSDDAFVNMLLAERVLQIEMARNIIPKNVVEKFLQKDVPSLPERLPPMKPSLGRLNLKRISRQYLKSMARMIEITRKPWPQSLDEIIENASKASEKSKSHEVFSKMIGLSHLSAETLIAARCTTLTLAIERYRLSQNALPSSLNDLVPAYIDSIPTDPFTGKGLLYIHGANGYIIYSVGVNRTDDGGATISAAPETPPLDRGVRIQTKK